MALDVNQPAPLNTTGVEQQPEVPRGQPKKLIGIFILVVLLLGVTVIAIQKSQNQQVPETPQETTESLVLSLSSPTEGDIAVDGEIVVRGKTLPNTTVVIYTQSDETSVESDENGNFEETILLVDGENTLTVTAFSEDGQEKSMTVTVVSGGEV